MIFAPKNAAQIFLPIIYVTSILPAVMATVATRNNANIVGMDFSDISANPPATQHCARTAIPQPANARFAAETRIKNAAMANAKINASR
jgi:hypothetical protein